MSINGWKYYNHALIPTCAPHEDADVSLLDCGNIWKVGGGIPLLARWTTDWDCGHETDWWYIIKDTPFDINALKAKRRYEIRKGNKNYDVRIINPTDDVESIYQVTMAAFSGWPEKYRPTITREWVASAAKSWKECYVFGAYSSSTKMLHGYAVVVEYNSYLSFSMLRSNPEAEKCGVNAAIINSILETFNDRFSEGFYICDGERTIRHETAFQDYLEKYFGFRKAYCKLNIKYRAVANLAVMILYPFRRYFKGNSKIGNQISAVLKMEEIHRRFQ